MCVRALLVVFLWIVSLSAARAADTPAAGQVLDASRAASGGDAWNGRQALKVEYAYDGQGLTGHVTALVDLQRGRYVLTEEVGPARQVEGFDGVHAWTQDPSGAVTIQAGGDAAQLGFNQAYRLANLWWRPDRAGAAVASAGVKTDGGSSFDVVTVTPMGGKPFDAWFDAVTHQLARVVEAQGPETVTTTYSDYRAVDGALLPFLVVIGHGDPKYDEHSRATSAAFQVAPRDQAFAPPTAGPADHGFLGAASQTTVPFRLLNNHIYAPVSVNGRPFTFLFDTGGQNLITPGTAKALGLKSQGSFQGGGAGEGHVEFGLTKVEELRIGRAFIRNQLLPVAPLDALAEVEGVPQDGIVGFETFRRFVTRIDYGAGTITLIDPKRFRAGEAGVAIPFSVDGTNILIPAKYDGQEGNFILDTGSRGSVTLSTAFAKAHGVDPATAAGVRGLTGWGFGGASRGVVTRARSFEIGPFRLGRQIVGISTDKGGSFADPSIAGNIGGAVLKRFVVTLDYDHSTLYLKPVRGKVADLDTFDRSGVWLNRTAEGFRILDVIAGSPGDQAGLKAGDEVLSVDGRPAKGLSLHETRLKLRTLPPGTVVRFTVRSGAQTRTVKVVLRDLV